MKNWEINTKDIEVADYPEELRNLVEGYALGILSYGRPGWDVPHTLAVVRWANKLARAQGLNVKVLTTAAYLHDIGYYGQFEGSGSANLSEVVDRKERHMLVGAAMATSFLNGVEVEKYLAKDHVERIVYLISVHDWVGELRSLDEVVLMEADSLGAIDVDFVEPTYRGEEALTYLETRMVKRRKRFVTPEAMQAYDDLAERFRAFVEVRDFLPGEVERWTNEGGSS